MTSELEKQINGLLVPEFAGWCPVEKAMTLAKVILDAKPINLVEVGVFGGRSLIPMGLALRQNGFGSILGIDPWDVGAAVEGDVGKENAEWWSRNVDLEEIYRGFIMKVMELGLTRQCRWLRIRSEQAVRLFEDRSIHLFHLDSNHSELVSCRDVGLWKEKVSDNGFWVMDDTNWTTQHKAIDMILQSGFKMVLNGETYGIFKRL